MATTTDHPESAAMSRTLAALASGLVFGIGLAMSGMMDPKVVLGFLDVASFPDGGWDPSLAFVMGGALAVTLPGFAWLRRRGHPVLNARLHWPTATEIDARLVGGAALFGVGWGLVGICPGPAIAAISTGLMPAILFFGAMVAGMAVHRVMTGR